jgi:hypothetical protein
MTGVIFDLSGLGKNVILGLNQNVQPQHSSKRLVTRQETLTVQYRNSKDIGP